jgi:hypothetical protein
MITVMLHQASGQFLARHQAAEVLFVQLVSCWGLYDNPPRIANPYHPSAIIPTMTEGCPVAHDDKSRSGPIFFSTKDALRRLHAGDHPNDIFVSSKGKVTFRELKDRDDAIAEGKKDRINTLFAASALDIASQLSNLYIARPDEIMDLDTQYLPLSSSSIIDRTTLNGLYVPLINFIVGTETEEIINNWATKPIEQVQAGSILDPLVTRHDVADKEKAREIIAKRLESNTGTASDEIPGYYRALLKIYEQQIRAIDPVLAEHFPSPSLNTFQDLIHGSLGILLRQATKNDTYQGIIDTAIPLLNNDYEPKDQETGLRFNKLPSGKLRVSIAPRTRTEIEAQFDKETVPDQIITGCPAMPLIQAMLQRVDSYIEAFKEE